MIFEYASGTYDWRYPIDLCAGMYICEDMLRLLQQCSSTYGSLALKNPNTLEFYGNKYYFDNHTEMKNIGGCLSGAVCSTVTVNIVQSQYQVPIYETLGGDVATLNNYVMTSKEQKVQVLFNFQTYWFSILYESCVHIGKLYLSHTDNYVLDEGKIVKTKPELSVLLPVHNGMPYLIEALESIIIQKDICFEIIMVDDGSSDDGVSETLKLCEKHHINVIISDRNSGCSIETECREHYHKNVVLKIIKVDHVGLVRALDIGIEESSTNLIVRMDSDDICVPGRLKKQYQFMLSHPEINVLGGQALAFTNAYDGGTLISSIFTHPVVVDFSMMVKCAVLHPTVIFRKNAVTSVGSYSGALRKLSERLSLFDINYNCDVSEDYALWAVILHRFCLDILKL
jgi:hypothetical protein